MLGTTRVAVSGNGNNVAGRDMILNMYSREQGVHLYEPDIVRVINELNDNIESLNTSEKNENDLSDDFSYIEMERKNQLNNLSEAYFKDLREIFLPYFLKIDGFLKNPQNEKLCAKYKRIALIIKTTISASRDKFDTFEDVLSHISEKLRISDECDSNVDQFTYLVFLNYMYFNCDIGRKE